MSNTNEIIKILARMIEILESSNMQDWAREFGWIKNNFTKDPARFSLKLLSYYGGGGSLNDIILYKDHQLLIDKNNEFDILRTQLYENCKFGLKN